MNLKILISKLLHYIANKITPPKTIQELTTLMKEEGKYTIETILDSELEQNQKDDIWNILDQHASKNFSEILQDYAFELTSKITLEAIEEMQFTVYSLNKDLSELSYKEWKIFYGFGVQINNRIEEVASIKVAILINEIIDEYMSHKENKQILTDKYGVNFTIEE